MGSQARPNLVTELPVTGVVALHDLDPAAMYCDQVVVLEGGRVVAAGTPGDTLTGSLIADVHGVRAAVARPGPGDRLHIRFLGTVAGNRRGCSRAAAGAGSPPRAVRGEFSAS